MEKTGLQKKFERSLLNERLIKTELTKSSLWSAKANVQNDLVDIVKQAGQSKDVGLILEIERAFIENDMAHYVNSDKMDKSVKAALDQVKGAQMTFGEVHDPQKYSKVNDHYITKPNRDRMNLPKDQVQQFFNSNRRRLDNMSTASLSDEEKAIIKVRTSNMYKGLNAYKTLQKQALGII